MISPVRAFPAFFLVLVAFPALADIAPETRWSDPSSVSIDVDFPGDGYHAAWDLYRCECGDLLIHSELSELDSIEKGETLLVGGRAVLFRGFPRHQAEYGASLDAPALMLQLAAQLLERLEPGGPSKITEQVEREITELNEHIYLDSGTAAGAFQAPWKVAGMMAPGKDDLRRFDLRLDFSVLTGGGMDSASMRLKGHADYARVEFPIAPAESLEGWNLEWSDSDDPARTGMKGIETLEQLRALLKATPQQ